LLKLGGVLKSIPILKVCPPVKVDPPLAKVSDGDLVNRIDSFPALLVIKIAVRFRLLCVINVGVVVITVCGKMNHLTRCKYNVKLDGVSAVVVNISSDGTSETARYGRCGTVKLTFGVTSLVALLTIIGGLVAEPRG
jgi:hypothetical protein